MSFQDLLASADRSVRKLLGQTVTYTPGAGSPVEVRGVFDARYQRLEAGETGVSSTGPAVFLRLDELPSNPSSDLARTVTINGVVYRPFEVMPDGLGGVHMLLHEV